MSVSRVTESLWDEIVAELIRFDGPAVLGRTSGGAKRTRRLLSRKQHDIVMPLWKVIDDVHKAAGLSPRNHGNVDVFVGVGSLAKATDPMTPTWIASGNLPPVLWEVSSCPKLYGDRVVDEALSVAKAGGVKMVKFADPEVEPQVEPARLKRDKKSSRATVRKGTRFA